MEIKSSTMQKWMSELITKINVVEKKPDAVKYMNDKNEPNIEDNIDEKSKNKKRVWGEMISIEEVKEDFEHHTLVSNEDLDELISNLKDLKEMSKTIHDMITEQDEGITTIEKNVESAESNLIKSEKELNIALKYKKDGIVNVVGVAGGAVAGSFFGPIGALAGAGVGLLTTLSVNVIRKNIKNDK